MAIRMNLQYFGGRGAGSGIPDGGTPSGGGGGNGPMDAQPGLPATKAEALGKKGRPMSTDKAVLGANPFFDPSQSSREYNENCQRAVIATEARFRGYDVIASPTFDNDTMPHGDNYTKNFKDAPTPINIGKRTKHGTIISVERYMKEQGDGARAILAVDWNKGNSGHVINVVQRNGKTYYYDGQTGRKFTARKFFTNVISKNTTILRTDNLEFSDTVRESVRQNPNKK